MLMPAELDLLTDDPLHVPRVGQPIFSDTRGTFRVRVDRFSVIPVARSACGSIHIARRSDTVQRPLMKNTLVHSPGALV